MTLRDLDAMQGGLCRNLGRMIPRYADAGEWPISDMEFCHAHARVRMARTRAAQGQRSSRGQSAPRIGNDGQRAPGESSAQMGGVGVRGVGNDRKRSE
jgi:hypothetical protein